MFEQERHKEKDRKKTVPLFSKLFKIKFPSYEGTYFSGNILLNTFFVYFFGGLECVGHSFAYVAHFVFLRDVWIRTQRAAVASRATHLPNHLLNTYKEHVHKATYQ